MLETENFVSVRSISSINVENLIEFFKSESGGGDILREKTIIINDKQVIVCFKDVKDAANVLKKSVHTLVCPSGLVLIFNVERVTDLSLIASFEGNQQKLSNEKFIEILQSQSEDLLQINNQKQNFSFDDKSMTQNYVKPFSQSCSYTVNDSNAETVIVQNSLCNNDEKNLCELNIKTPLQPNLFVSDKKTCDTIEPSLCYLKTHSSESPVIHTASEKDNQLIHRSEVADTVLDIKENSMAVKEQDVLWDTKKLLISKLSSEVSFGTMYGFVVDIMHENPVDKIVKGTAQGNWLICFNNDIDFLKVKDLAKNHQLSDLFSYIQQIPMTSQIQVTNLSSKITKDILFTHFSFDGKVTCVDIHQNNEIAVITFEDYRVIPQVIKNKHVLLDQVIQVSSFHSCVGYQHVDLLRKCICETEVESTILNYVMNHKSHFEDLKNILHQNNGELDFLLSDETKLVVRRYFTKYQDLEWEKNILKQIKTFLSNYKHSLLIINKNHFESVKTFIKRIKLPDNVDLNINEEMKTINIVGQKNSVDSTNYLINSYLQKEKKEVVFTPLEIKFLLLQNIISDLTAMNVKTVVEEVKGRVILEGEKMVLISAIDMLQIKRSKLTKSNIVFSEEKWSFLKNKSCQIFINSQFNLSSIIAVFEFFQGNTVMIISDTKESVDKAEMIIQNLIKQMKIFVIEKFLNGHFNTKLVNLIKVLNKSHKNNVNITLVDNVIKIIYLTHFNIFGLVFRKLENILEENFFSEVTFCLEPFGSFGNFLMKYYKNEFQVLQEKYDITIKTYKKKLILCGPQQNIRLTISELYDCLSQIITEKYSISKPKIDFCHIHVKECLNVINQKNNCLIKTLKTSVKELSSVYKDFCEAKISVKCRNIVYEDVDVIINGIYYNSLKKGTISRSIVEAAGSVIEDEFDHAVPLETDIKVTSGGKLSCTKIIHLNLKFDSNLQKKILRCFIYAEDQHFTSIALPAFGTGNFGINAEDIAKLLLEAVKDFNAIGTNKYLTDIRFIIFDMATYSQFIQVLDQEQTWNEVTFDENRIFFINGLNIELIEGDIFNEDADILVNSIGKDLDLNRARGIIAQKIKEFGGSEIVEECQNLGKANSDGLAYTTAGYLNFNFIIHFVTDDNDFFWSNRVTKCLEMADKLKANTILMPALGTGVGLLSAEKCAKIILKGILQLSTTNCLSLIKIVNFDSGNILDFTTVFQKYSVIKEEPDLDKDVHYYPPITFTIHAKDSSQMEKIKKDINDCMNNKLLQKESCE